MSDMDDKLRSAYGRLPREEPPAALDAAILDASRRAVAPRRSTQRWAIPLSVAAVFVLAFGIAIHRDEYPSSYEESKMAAPQAVTPRPMTPQAPPQDAVAKVEAPSVSQAIPQPAAKPDASPAVRAKKTANAAALRDERAPEQQAAGAEAGPERKDFHFAPEPQAKLQKETANVPSVAAAPPMQERAAAAPAAPPAPARTTTDMFAAPPPASVSSAAPAASSAPDAVSSMAAPAAREAEAPRAQSRLKAEAGRQAPAGAAANLSAPDEITRELDAIAKLRTEHRDEEADKALEAFRRKHPDYRIPDAVWERVRPR